MQVLNNNNVKLAEAMANQNQHQHSDKRFSNVMATIQKNHQDAVAVSELAHRSMDALDHDFVILGQLINYYPANKCPCTTRKGARAHLTGTPWFG